MGTDRVAARAGRVGLALRSASLGALLILAIASVSCSGRVTVQPMPAASPPTATLSPTVEGSDTGAGPSVTIASAVQACREKDGDRLRAFVAIDVSDSELEALFARGSDVLLKSQVVPNVEGVQTEIDVRLEIRRDGETETVDRTWRLARGADGVWRLTSLPDCF